MSKLSIIVRNEYMTDIRSKSFWIGTFLMPVIFVLFGVFIGYMAESSDTLLATSNPLASPDNPKTGWQIAGMLVGILLTLFIMIYGAQIFNKVKSEKCNRIMEVLSTCVNGRTMMLGKIISVALVGLTQMALWAVLLSVCAGGSYTAVRRKCSTGNLWRHTVVYEHVVGYSVFCRRLHILCIHVCSYRGNDRQEPRKPRVPHSFDVHPAWVFLHRAVRGRQYHFVSSRMVQLYSIHLRNCRRNRRDRR